MPGDANRAGEEQMFPLNVEGTYRVAQAHRWPN